MNLASSWWIYALVAAAVTLALAPFASALGLVQAERSGEFESNQRDPGRRAALVGGLGLFAALWLSAWQARALGQSFEPALALQDWLGARFLGAGLSIELAGASALVAAVLLGLIDDRLGLQAGAKLAGQCALGAILAWPTLAAQPTSPWAWAVFAGLVAAAVVACNVINTFDNADGVVVGLSCPALWRTFPVLAAGCLALIPLQCLRRGSGLLARTFLGDSGSNLLALALLLSPKAWPCLALPALDLARVACERVRRGTPPWIGDRTHLAHRLQRRALGPAAVAASLTLASGPTLVLALGLLPTSAANLGLCLAATLVLFGLLLRF